MLTLALCGAASAQLTLWTTEEQPDRIAVQERIAADFEAQTGISVTVVPVNEAQMGERVTAAFAAGELPDVIYHPLNYTLGWTEAGILDTFAATEVVELLGEETFSAGALSLVEVAGEYAAVPVDGWTQLLLYRADLFEEAGLEAPSSYEAILAAIDALHNPPERYGFVAATDVSQPYMLQVFEHFALANGVQLVDDEGNVTLDTPEMVETLEFYKRLVEASPAGNLYWEQSRELYHAGRAAMIVWSPFILDELAGLRDDVPVTAFDDPTTSELAERTGFLTRLSGPSFAEGAGWSDIRYFGITVDADVDAAMQFVEYSMSEGYVDTLSVAAEGKIPVRRGPADDPEAFVEAWSNLEVGVDRRAPLSDFYSAELLGELVAGLETANRWAFAQGQGLLYSRMADTRVLVETLREFLDGDRSAEETASLMQERVAALQQ
ncbi:extracellular solute-binding protein [Truepera radiovictrix]|nr:extracellular solute-binding protein [Truepera radiovictrix]WMT57359.1 extracellular solute-binding protein [Truepera radiovictrix]